MLPLCGIWAWVLKEMDSYIRFMRQTSDLLRSVGDGLKTESWSEHLDPLGKPGLGLTAELTLLRVTIETVIADIEARIAWYDDTKGRKAAIQQRRETGN